MGVPPAPPHPTHPTHPKNPTPTHGPPPPLPAGTETGGEGKGQFSILSCF